MPSFSGPCASGPYVANGLLAHSVHRGDLSGLGRKRFVLENVDRLGLRELGTTRGCSIPICGPCFYHSWMWRGLRRIYCFCFFYRKCCRKEKGVLFRNQNREAGSVPQSSLRRKGEDLSFHESGFSSVVARGRFCDSAAMMWPYILIPHLLNK